MTAEKRHFPPSSTKDDVLWEPLSWPKDTVFLFVMVGINVLVSNDVKEGSNIKIVIVFFSQVFGILKIPKTFFENLISF